MLPFVAKNNHYNLVNSPWIEPNCFIMFRNIMKKIKPNTNASNDVYLDKNDVTVVGKTYITVTM